MGRFGNVRVSACVELPVRRRIESERSLESESECGLQSEYDGPLLALSRQKVSLHENTSCGVRCSYFALSHALVSRRSSCPEVLTEEE